MGTKDLTFVQLNQLIGRKTGGISVYPFTSSIQNKEDPCSHIIVRGKSMTGCADDLFNLVCIFFLILWIDILYLLEHFSLQTNNDSINCRLIVFCWLEFFFGKSFSFKRSIVLKVFFMSFNCRLIVFFKKYSLQTNNGSSSLCPKAKQEWRYIFWIYRGVSGEIQELEPNLI